ncbi:hypothetical protein VNO80_09786 [Phaseolus coccineus]|uniref:Uncharacterized protein n=1 Tax=Phaseolus coccineus TaxID=3886 RepID=A0AAN9NC62_PHACN
MEISPSLLHVHQMIPSCSASPLHHYYCNYFLFYFFSFITYPGLLLPAPLRSKLSHPPKNWNPHDLQGSIV